MVNDISDVLISVLDFPDFQLLETTFPAIKGLNSMHSRLVLYNSPDTLVSYLPQEA